jgi:CBS domain containing-hemolysin-like protein
MAQNSEDGEKQPSPKERSGVLKRIKGMFGRRKLDDESAQIIESLENEETLSSNKREMLFKVASFDKLTIGDIMIPRADIIAVDAETNLGELARIFSDNQHSRIPIYRDNLDNPIGFVHVKDVLELLTPDESGKSPNDMAMRPLSKIRRDLLYVPLSMRLPNLLVQMRAQRKHIALVVDEYGGTDGLVTIEDLVEEIIGDIDDEYDDDTNNGIIVRPNHSWEVLAKVEIEEFANFTGLDDLVNDEIGDDIDTLGGLAFALAGHIPPRGEIISHPNGYELEIIEADPRKIRKILFRVKNPIKESD